MIIFKYFFFQTILLFDHFQSILFIFSRLLKIPPPPMATATNIRSDGERGPFGAEQEQCSTHHGGLVQTGNLRQFMSGHGHLRVVLFSLFCRRRTKISSGLKNWNPRTRQRPFSKRVTAIDFCYTFGRNNNQCDIRGQGNTPLNIISKFFDQRQVNRQVNRWMQVDRQMGQSMPDRSVYRKLIYP